MTLRRSRPQWIPIWTAAAGDTVIQTLSSGRSNDLARAMMTMILTVCTFDCPNVRMDLLQVGKAYITVHHHIYAEHGWMTAHQAADRGVGKLGVDIACDKVYCLSLHKGGNILVNTSEPLQQLPTHLVVATMGCHLELPLASQLMDSLIYPLNNLAKLEQIEGMDTGCRHFGPNDVTTQPNGELCLREDMDRREDWLPTPERRMQMTTSKPVLCPSICDTYTQQRINHDGTASNLWATSYPHSAGQSASAVGQALQDTKSAQEGREIAKQELSDTRTPIAGGDPKTYVPNPNPRGSAMEGILWDKGGNEQNIKTEIPPLEGIWNCPAEQNTLATDHTKTLSLRYSSSLPEGTK